MSDSLSDTFRLLLVEGAGSSQCEDDSVRKAEMTMILTSDGRCTLEVLNYCREENHILDATYAELQLKRSDVVRIVRFLGGRIDDE